MAERTKPPRSTHPPNGAPDESFLGSVLGFVRWRLTVSLLAQRLLLLAAALAIFPMLVVIGDHLAAGGLARPVIFGAGILWAAAAVLGWMGISIRTTTRRFNDAFVARHVERVHGIEHNPLLNTVLLDREGEATYAHDVAIHQAAEALDRTDWRAGGGAGLKRSAVWLLTAAVLWLIYASISSKPILPSLARMAGFDRAAPTATQVKLLRPDDEQPVYVGEPLEFEFSLTGRPVESAAFDLTDPQDGSTSALLRRDVTVERRRDQPDRALVLLAANEVARDLHYRFTAGDAALQGVISVIPRAELTDLKIQLTPPAYTGEPVTQTNGGDLQVWAGTRAEIVATANTDIETPVFVLRGDVETRTRMRVTPAKPRQTTLSTMFLRSGDYWVEFSDVHGRECLDPRVGRVTVRHDQPPTVEIVTPSREDSPGGVVDVRHVAILRVAAFDDVGLAKVLVVTDRDGDTSRRQIFDGGAGNAANASVELEVPTADFDLPVGGKVVVRFEAVDDYHKLDGAASPQTATSRSLTLVRTAEPAPDAGAEKLPDKKLADAGETTTETVKKTVQGGEGGGKDESAGEDKGDSTRNSGLEGDDRIYRPTTEDGGDSAGETSERLGPGAVVEGGDGETENGSAGDGEAPDDPNSSAAEAKKLREELRTFQREHGDEAREVRKVLGQRGKNQEDQSGGAANAGKSQGQRGPLDAETKGDEDQPESQPAEQNSSQSGAEERQQLDLKSGNPPPASQPQDSEEERSQERQEPPEDKPQNQAQASQPAEKSASTRPASPPQSPESQPSTSAAKPAEKNAKTNENKRASDGPEKPASHEKPASPEKPANPEKSAGDASSRSKSDKQANSEKRENRENDANQPANNAGSKSDNPKAEQPEQRGGDQTKSTQDKRTQSQANAQTGAQTLPESGDRLIQMQGESRLDLQAPREPASTENETANTSPSANSPSEMNDTLELLARGKDISDDELAKLDWPPAQRQAFIEAFKRLRETASRAGGLSLIRRLRSTAQLGSADVSTGAAVSGGLSPDVSTDASSRSGLDQIAPDREQRVAPELQAILDAYYRSLAERRKAE